MSYNRIAIRIYFCFSISIAHKLKSVFRLVCNLIVFVTYVLQHLKIMKPTSVYVIESEKSSFNIGHRPSKQKVR